MTPQETFVTRLRLVHHWRSFLFLDPGLGASLAFDPPSVPALFLVGDGGLVRSTGERRTVSS